MFAGGKGTLLVDAQKPTSYFWMWAEEIQTAHMHFSWCLPVSVCTTGVTFCCAPDAILHLASLWHHEGFETDGCVTQPSSPTLFSETIIATAVYIYCSLSLEIMQSWRMEGFGQGRKRLSRRHFWLFYFPKLWKCWWHKHHWERMHLNITLILSVSTLMVKHSMDTRKCFDRSVALWSEATAPGGAHLCGVKDWRTIFKLFFCLPKFYQTSSMLCA